VHFVAHDLFHLEHDLAVVKKQHVARAYVAWKLLVVQADAPSTPSSQSASSTKASPGFRTTLPSLNLPIRILGPCRSPMMRPCVRLAASLAHQLGAALVIPGRPVREIHAHHVHSSEKHALERLRIAGSGTESGDDFGASAQLTLRVNRSTLPDAYEGYFLPGRRCARNFTGYGPLWTPLAGASIGTRRKETARSGPGPT